MARTVKIGIALLALGLLVGVLLFYDNTRSELIISDRMSEFIDAVDRHPAYPRNKLVAIDLDDTAFMSNKLLGSPTWFYNMINLMRQQGAAKQEAYEIMSKIDKFVQERNGVVLIEQATLSAVKSWQQQGVLVVGFSSRLKGMVHITEKQLSDVGLNFSSSFFNCVENKWPKEDGAFIKGVLYVDNYANKAKILNHLYDRLTACGMQVDLIAQAEDQQHYISDVARLAKKRKVDFIGMIYGGALSRKDFDLKKANQQLLDLEIASNSVIIPDEYRRIFSAN
jgi:hypothetical protein